MDEMTFQTNGLMMQLAEIRERQAANEAARATASSLTEVGKVEAEDEQIAMALWSARMSCRVMPDTPPEEIVPILAVRVADAGAHFFKDKPKVDGHAKWCSEVERHGGPSIDPDWLRAYMTDHLAGRERAIDAIVQQAMVIRDGRVIPPGGVLMDVDTGKPIRTA
ncbi:hypothetical protein [Methylobacterium flocculans]|uniref:hypothetical protein n=1 Tax=Methylobacterium flocculans TaxID=2984843 RepID=UPI0021F31EB9|nr:hypothetical protein [Methylobacterium sp. FF17]